MPRGKWIRRSYESSIFFLYSKSVRTCIVELHEYGAAFYIDSFEIYKLSLGETCTVLALCLFGLKCEYRNARRAGAFVGV